MMKIGLIAHRKTGSLLVSSAYKVLYTLRDVQVHNSNPNNFPVQEEALEVAKLLGYNSAFQEAIKTFQDQFGGVTDDKDRIAVYNRQYFNGQKYFNLQKSRGIQPLKSLPTMEQYFISCYGKYRVIFDVKEMAKDHLLSLFFAGVLDTRTEFWIEWSNAPITHTSLHGNLNINIRYNNVKKNAIIKYIETHWKALKEEIKGLPSKGEYKTSERDWQIYELKQKGKSYSKIADYLAQNDPDPDAAMSDEAVKTAYQRVCKRINSVFIRTS